jgi:plastocyanin
MEDKCPKCGETLLTRTIEKKIGLGSIDYPIAQTCPKCNWNKDLTGAGDIISKPVMQVASEAQKEEKKAGIKSQITPSISTSSKNPTSINSLIPIVLAILVVAAIAWVFFMNPADDKKADNFPIATPPAIINQTPVQTPTTTIIPEVTASGKKVPIRLESDRGFTPKNTTIKQGDEVVWVNDGTYNLILVSSENIFPEKLMNMGKREMFVFMKSGNYNFFFKGKENLKGTVIVEP